MNCLTNIILNCLKVYSSFVPSRKNLIFVESTSNHFVRLRVYIVGFKIKKKLKLQD